MNFVQMQDLTLTYLDDLSAGYFTRPQGIRFLNNAFKEVHKQLNEANNNWYLSCRKAVLTPNQACYFLPDDFYAIHRLDVITSNVGIIGSECRSVVDRVTPQEIMRIRAQTGVPAAYFIKKNQIEIKPAPDSAYTIELLYSYRISELSQDSAIADIPEEYQEYAALLAVQDGFVRDQREPTSQFMAKLRSYLELMKQTSSQRDKTRSRSVVIQGDYGFGSGY